VVGGQEPRESDSHDEQAAGSTEPKLRPAFGELLSQVPADIRDVSFPTAVRGYDRREVDAYVERVNRVIAELEISRSPQSAVKHALDRVGEQTSGVLQRAREVAEELTGTALAEAEHATRRAKVEAEEMLENAQMQAHQLRGQSKEEADEIIARASDEAAARLKRAEDQIKKSQADAEGRLRALRADIEAAADGRRVLLDELRRSATELEEFAAAMISRPQPEQATAKDADAPTQRMPRKAAAPSTQGGDASSDSPEPMRPRKPERTVRTSPRHSDAADGDSSDEAIA
jgi:DivIVA domain-containing protein